MGIWAPRIEAPHPNKNLLFWVLLCNMGIFLNEWANMIMKRDTLNCQPELQDYDEFVILYHFVALWFLRNFPVNWSLKPKLMNGCKHWGGSKPLFHGAREKKRHLKFLWVLPIMGGNPEKKLLVILKFFPFPKLPSTRSQKLKLSLIDFFSA